MSFSKQFIEILDAICEKVGLVIDWTSQNVIPYLHELSGRIINYEIATSATWIVLTLLVSIPLLLKLNKYNKENDWDEMAVVFIIGISIIAIVIIGAETFDIVQAITLPEKTLIEFGQEVMQSIK